MHKDYLSLLDGKTNLWKRIMLEYPVKIEEQLSPEDKELKLFIYYATHAIDTCFEPAGEEKIYDLDIYSLQPIDMKKAFDMIVEALLCFYFLEHGYHHNMAERYASIREQMSYFNIKDSHLYDWYKDKLSMASITKECYWYIAAILLIPLKQDNMLNFYSILQVYYNLIKSDLKRIDKIKIVSLALTKQAYDLDNKSSC